MQGFESFPPWVQVVASLVVFGVSAGLWVYGILKKVEAKPDSHPELKVLGAAWGDTQTMMRIAESSEQAVHELRELRGDIGRLSYIVEGQAGHIREIRRRYEDMPKTGRR